MEPFRDKEIGHQLGPVPQDPIDPKKEGKPDLKHGLETYASDLAKAMRDSQGSVVKIAIAEQTRKEKIREDASPASKKNHFFIIGTVILLVLALAAGGYYYISQKKTVVVTQNQTEAPTLIFSDRIDVLEATGFTRDKLEALLRQ